MHHNLVSLSADDTVHIESFQAVDEVGLEAQTQPSAEAVAEISAAAREVGTGGDSDRSERAHRQGRRSTAAASQLQTLRLPRPRSQTHSASGPEEALGSLRRETSPA